MPETFDYSKHSHLNKFAQDKSAPIGRTKLVKFGLNMQHICP